MLLKMTFRVRTTAEHRPVVGLDSCIMNVPASVYANVGDGQAIDTRVLGALLRMVSNAAAAGVGETLHHAEWVITDDPAVVEKKGMCGRPDCARCRSEVDQALAHLAEHRKALLVGVLYWAG